MEEVVKKNEEVVEENSEVNNELEEMTDRYKRILAEFENHKKRSQKFEPTDYNDISFVNYNSGGSKNKR